MVVIVLVFGVLIAPTAFGRTVFDIVGQELTPAVGLRCS
jgi:hypothetical protein